MIATIATDRQRAATSAPNTSSSRISAAGRPNGARLLEVALGELREVVVERASPVIVVAKPFCPSVCYRDRVHHVPDMILVRRGQRDEEHRRMAVGGDR